MKLWIHVFGLSYCVCNSTYIYIYIYIRTPERLPVGPTFLMVRFPNRAVEWDRWAVTRPWRTQTFTSGPHVLNRSDSRNRTSHVVQRHWSGPGRRGPRGRREAHGLHHVTSTLLRRGLVPRGAMQVPSFVTRSGPPHLWNGRVQVAGIHCTTLSLSLHLIPSSRVGCNASPLLTHSLSLPMQRGPNANVLDNPNE